MGKYKLIKWHSSLPDDWKPDPSCRVPHVIVENLKGFQLTFEEEKPVIEQYEHEDGYVFDSSEIRGNPEFWEPVLFTTEDGVEICKGDKYYFVNRTNPDSIMSKKCGHYCGNKDCRIYFADKERAKEWLHMNKLSYSQEDIWRALNHATPNLKFNLKLFISSLGLKKECGNSHK